LAFFINPVASAHSKERDWLALTMQATHRLDVLGHFCPVPVSQARRALEKLPKGSLLEVIADDPETMHDLPMMVARLGQKMLEMEASAGEFRFIIEVV
jgi:TusA-related sulfurtransferase